MVTFYTYLKTESIISSRDQDKSHLTEPENDIKSIVKGKVGNKLMTLSEVKSLFLTLKNSSAPVCTEGGSDKEFCLLANGFWQAEGYIGGIFSSPTGSWVKFLSSLHGNSIVFDRKCQIFY